MDTLNIKKQVEILNDLVQVNNDRIEGYKKALEELNEQENQDLKPFFNTMINNSTDYNEELEKLIELYDGATVEGTSGAGKIYRAWMDLKALFTGGDRKAILDSCETGEATAVRAYNDALSENDLSEDVQKLITIQKTEIQEAYTEIKALRDALL